MSGPIREPFEVAAKVLTSPEKDYGKPISVRFTQEERDELERKAGDLSLSAKFETIDVEEGDLTPQYVLIIEWPSLDAFEAAAQDPRTVRNLALRSGAVRDFHIGFFTIPETTTLTFTDDVVYEFFAGVSASAETPNQLQTFFQNVIPTAMQYGRADALILTPVQHERNTYFRPIAGLAIWPTAAHFEQFTNTTVFRENVEQYRNPAFAELELINTYFVE